MRDPRKNPFLVLGVSNDAEMSAIQSVGKRRLMALRLDDDADPGVVRRIESALETLADPVERFEWGLLAPELTDAEADAFRADPILSTLSENPQQEAVSAYERICEADNAATRAHNVGVLKFVQAVAATEEAQKGTPDDISDDLECVELWKVAYRNLRLAFGSDKFWMRQRLRAKSYQDQRLDAERIKRIQSGIFREVIAPVGEVVRDALLSRHGEVAKAYVGLVRASGFENAFVDDVLSEVYKPLADRVEKAVSALEERLKQAGDEAKEYQAILRVFKRNAEPDLKVMISVGDLPGYAEEHARDASAAFLRRLSIAAWNNSRAIDVSKSAIRLAERIVDSDADRQKYKKDIADFVGLEKQKRRTEEFGPLFNRLTAALERDNFEAGLAALEELINRGADDDGTLSQLRRTIATNLSTQHFNKGMAALNAGDLVTARRWMGKSLEVETNPSERTTIRKALVTIGELELRQASSASSSTGCLIAILQLMVGSVLMGLIGGGLHACSQ